MAAPTPTVRQSPVGRKMPEGYQSEITFALNPSVCIWEIAPKPPGLDGGEPISTTTMFNQVWHTMAPQTLVKMDPMTVKFAYDPAAVVYLKSLLNSRTTITVKLPTNATWCFYGYLQKVEWDALEIGKMPEGTATIVVTNEDPSTLTEAGPVYTPAGGTP